MFSAAKKNNLKNTSFQEKDDIEKRTDQLLADNPYSASLPLIASATLGDEQRYVHALVQMLAHLGTLETAPEKFDSWMRSNSFKAWMWGRVLLAAKSMDDGETIKIAKEKLSALLGETANQNDNPAFFAWAWGYRAALNNYGYQETRQNMMDAAMQLSEKSLAQPNNHDALSDALWAWVMNLSAAANADDQEKYSEIKNQILRLTGKKSVVDALDTGLVRTDTSTDFPAWGLAKLRHAAASMKDSEVFHEAESVLVASIEKARESKLPSAKAEYIVSVLEGELAKMAGNGLQHSPRVKF